MDVFKLKDAELVICSYDQITCIIEEISQFVAKQHRVDSIELSEMIPLLEQSDELFGKITIIQKKVSLDQFEDLPEDWEVQKEKLLNKVYSTQTAIQTIRDSYRMWIAVIDSNNRLADLQKQYQALTKDYDEKKHGLESDIFAFQITMQEKFRVQKQGFEDTQRQLEEQAQRLQETKKQLEEQAQRLQETKNQFDKQAEDIGKASTAALTEIRGAEGKIISHVLTLMGTFSAVITIILSIVVTSSSWLNNATSSSAIIAFVVPNLVTLSAVAALVILIYVFHKSFYPPLLMPNEKPSKVPDIVSAILLVFILIATLTLSVTANRHAEIESKSHIRYVIANNQYDVVEILDEATDTQLKFFEFTFEECNYQFPFDKEFLHNSSIYYCIEHGTLE